MEILRLKDDADFMLRALELRRHSSIASTNLLKVTSHRLKDDRSIVLQALTKYCHRDDDVLQFASDRLKNDFESNQIMLTLESSSIEKN